MEQIINLSSLSDEEEDDLDSGLSSNYFYITE